MRLERSFTVAAPLEDVWRMLVDVEQVAPCLPGAEIGGRNEDGTYGGTFSLRLGPSTASREATLEMVDVDADAHRARLLVRSGEGRRGPELATIASALSEDEGGTRVDVDAEFTVPERLERLGGDDMVDAVSRRLLRDFASCLGTRVSAPAGAASPPPARPVGGISLYLSTLWRRFRRRLGGSRG